MDSKKKRFLALSLSFIMATTIISDKLQSSSKRIYTDETIDNPHYIGSCEDGDVYFASKKEIEELIESGVDGILIIDERNDKDPNVQIIDSCDIKSVRTMKDVLTIVKNYDDENPSKWSRTIKSMVNEWWIHNFCYDYDFYQYRTKDVDLNNADEENFETFNLHKLVLRKKELDR